MQKYLSYGSLMLMLMLPTLSWGQQASETFGKNRIQYQQFSWKYYSSGNYDLYFYEGGKELADKAVDYLKQEFDRITDALGYAPLNKTKIFLYNSHSDLLQSNIGVNESYQSVAGETVFVKNVVEIAYPGTLEAFKRELVFRITSQLLQEMMFGGSLTDMFQNAYLLNLPEWFIPGAARYIAYGWDSRMDDYMRELMVGGRLRKLDRYQGEEAALLGQSIWNFIAEKHGRSNISSILNLTRIIRNEERSIANTLGTTFGRFQDAWEEYYMVQSALVMKEYEFADPQFRVTNNNRRGVDRNRVSISPTSRYVAYTENDRGRYVIRLVDREQNREKAVIRGGYRLVNQQPNEDVPLLTWQDSVTLAVLVERQGGPALWLYNTESGEKQRVSLAAFHAVQHISFNDNGRLMAMSAEEEGQSDIYLVSLRRNVWRKLTNDAFDDEYPEFVPGTNTVVFSSNRQSDTLRQVSLREVGGDLLTFNLFAYDLDTTQSVLTRLTNTLSKDVFPIPNGDGRVYYLSDQKGINNVFCYSLRDSISTQLTNFAVSVTAVDINFRTREMAYVMEHKGQDLVYVQSIDLDAQRFTLPTPRQQRQQALYLANRLASMKRQEQPTVPVPENVDSAEVDPTALLDPDDYSFGAVEDAPMNPDAILDTDNYVFNPTSTQGLREANAQSSPNGGASSVFLQNFRRSHSNNRVAGPFDYSTLLSADNLVTSLEIDPLMGWGFSLGTEMHDLLENHYFKGGAFAQVDLQSGKVFLEYNYLPYKVDFGVRASRKSLLYRPFTLVTGNSQQRYSLNEIEFKAALPHSVSLRSEASAFFTVTQFQEMNPNYLIAPPANPTFENQSYAGLRGSVVFDNTVINGMNTMEGTRGKVALKNYFALGNPDLSFGNISADIRHYQPLTKNLILAMRGFYGVFYGPQRQNYLLGGVDNWLFRQTDNLDQANSPLAITDLKNNRQLLFAEYVTSLRGFNYNALNGRNALLANVELRVPLVRLLYSGPISSNFFRNLQLTGFYDIGSAWTGPSPWSPDNELNTEVIQEPGSSFRIELTNYNNPWLMSYGAGFRSVILGYYTKFDVAWPVQNYKVNTPRLMITIGYDF